VKLRNVTEGGETRILRDIETIRSLPGDAESTSFFWFCLSLQLAAANRLSRFDHVSPFRLSRPCASLSCLEIEVVLH